MKKGITFTGGALMLTAFFCSGGCDEEAVEPEGPPVYLGSWGTIGRGDGEFDYPCGIAVSRDGKVFVADWGNRRIQYFSAFGRFLGKWKADARDIDFGPDGNLYVLSFHNGVYCYTTNGSQLRRWGFEGSGQGGFYQPRAIACANDGKVYVADTYHSKIQYFTSGGSFVGSWGTYGEGNGAFDKPSGVAVASNGVVYVADAGNGRVQYFSPSGSFLGKFNRITEVPYHFINPYEVALGPDGKIFVGCYLSGVHYYSPDADYLGTFARHGLGEGKVVHPDGIAVSGKRVIYVTETASNIKARVQYFH